MQQASCWNPTRFHTKQETRSPQGALNKCVQACKCLRMVQGLGSRRLGGRAQSVKLNAGCGRVLVKCPQAKPWKNPPPLGTRIGVSSLAAVPSHAVNFGVPGILSPVSSTDVAA